jgi:hypothetical protein
MQGPGAGSGSREIAAKRKEENTRANDDLNG